MIKTAYNPIIDTTYKLLISEDEDKISKYFRENTSSCDINFNYTHGTTSFGDKKVIMWGKNIKYAIHELAHGAQMPYNQLGFKPCEELIAYTIEFLYNELIIRNISKDVKIKEK